MKRRTFVHVAWLVWIHCCLICTRAHGSKTHHCIHDDIEHQITTQFVAYEPDTQQRRRHLQQESAAVWGSIRIRPYYDPLTINTGSLSADKIQYLQSLISASIHYIQQFVSVRRINGPLLLNRCQRLWFSDAFAYAACALSDYQQSLQCQTITIPDAHLAESWYYEAATLQSAIYRPSGQGVVDADMVLYVTYGASKCAADGSTLAWASTCSLDQFGRPIAGVINYCAGALDTAYWKFDVGVTLHELMHTLIMSKSLFPFFYNHSASAFYNLDQVVVESRSSSSAADNSWIVTPSVAEHARAHFGCDSLMGAPLENEGETASISHWESKYLQSELMCSTIFSAMMYVSGFTLALMQDSGHYHIDDNYGESFAYGRNEGCSFIQGDCVDKNTMASNFEQYWCVSQTDDGCSSDYTTVAYCDITTYGANAIPPQFQYYGSSAIGGASTHDYCASRTSQTVGDYESICMDVRGSVLSSAAIQEYPLAAYGSSARCVQIEDGNERKHGYCFEHQCLLYDGLRSRYNAVRIMLHANEGILCSRPDRHLQKKSVEYGTFVTCPDVDAVCGFSTRALQCVFGEWSDALQRCVCSVGYIGDECSAPDTNRMASMAILSLVPITAYVSPQYGTGVCISASLHAVYKNIDGFYAYDGEYEGVPSYRFVSQPDDNEVRYLYFLRYYSQWNIARAKGDTLMFAFCAQPLTATQTIDVQYCAQWAIWSETARSYSYDDNLNVQHCTQSPTANPTASPTAAPTESPTLSPTVDPTSDPTKDPTSDPTMHPTVDPTADPTFHPTSTPTIDPTVDPTSDPTLDPTSDPTVDPTVDPTADPTVDPTVDPTADPTVDPTRDPTTEPTLPPTYQPTFSPTFSPTTDPSLEPTADPTVQPSFNPTLFPTVLPSGMPTTTPTRPIFRTTANTSLDEQIADATKRSRTHHSSVQWYMAVSVFGGFFVFALLGFGFMFKTYIRPRYNKYNVAVSSSSNVRRQYYDDESTFDESSSGINDMEKQLSHIIDTQHEPEETTGFNQQGEALNVYQNGDVSAVQSPVLQLAILQAADEPQEQSAVVDLFQGPQPLSPTAECQESLVTETLLN